MARTRERQVVHLGPQLTLWTDGGVLGRALARAVATSKGALVVGRGRKDDSTKGPADDHQTIAICCGNPSDAETWLLEMRSRKTPARDPVIVIGQRDSAGFATDPVFMNWPLNQAYINAGPRLLAEFLAKSKELQAIDDKDMAKGIADSLRAGIAARLHRQVHRWKSGVRAEAAEDLCSLEEFFQERGDAAGLGLCRQARTCLETWSAILGVEFGGKFEALLQTIVQGKTR